MVLPRLSGRSFPAEFVATGVVAWAGDDEASPDSSTAGVAMPPIDGDPFTLGVASGDPTGTSRTPTPPTAP